MADFWGDILSSVSSAGNSVQGFFDSSIGQAVARGIGGATSGAKKKEVAWDEGMFKMGVDNTAPLSRNDPAAKSNNFHETERQWLLRMKKFAGLSDDTAVKLGAK